MNKQEQQQLRSSDKAQPPLPSGSNMDRDNGSQLALGTRVRIRQANYTWTGKIVGYRYSKPLQSHMIQLNPWQTQGGELRNLTGAWILSEVEVTPLPDANLPTLP